MLADDLVLPRQRPTWMVRVGALAAIVVGWQLLGMALHTIWIPPFSDVLARIVVLIGSGRITPALWASFTTLIWGFLISAAIGVAIGAAMALSTAAEDAFRIYVETGLFIPHIVFAPVFFAFFGLSDWTLIAVVFIFCVFHIIVTTQTAIEAVDFRLHDMAVSFGGSRFRVFREVTLRAAAPMIFAGLRVGMGRAVKGLIVGEIFVTVVGLGALERQFSSSFDGPGMWAIATIIISFAFILTTVVQLFDRRINGWRRT